MPFQFFIISKNLNMSTFTLNFIIQAIAFLYCLHFCMGIRSNETDKLALLEIKAQIIDDNHLGNLKSWNHTLHFCQWFGVTCSHRHQRVTSLTLNSAKLTGFLSPFIGNLSFLRRLDLSNNSFGGTLPPEIGRLSRLQHLLFPNNTFEGQIPPNISSCTSLIELDTTSNNLEGGIPSEFSSLLNLQSISLGENSLTGTIPSSLGNLSSLYRLYLSYNNLTGSIPESFSKLKTLRELALMGNKLSGIVPTSIFNLTSSEVIDVGFNLLEGNLPLDMGNTLPNLLWFSISNNNFTGYIPTSVSNSSNLEFLQFGANDLQGQVPSLNKLVYLTHLTLHENSLGYGLAGDLNFVSSLANATNLQYFEIQDNNFGGRFPRVFCNFSFLTSLWIEDNHIAGQIPDCIENFVYLEDFVTYNNQLSGVIPQGIGKIQSLNILALFDNQLSGDIPATIGNLTKLAQLTLGGNKLEGQIPSTIGNCRNILTFDLSDNHLSGKIPTQVFGLSMYEIDFSKNHLTGSLPEEVGQLRNLVGLDVSENMLSGEIPSTLSGCVDLESLYMMGNSLQGSIPDALKALKNLKFLDLSRNNFSGKIPEFLVSLPLQSLNLSYNIDLEGEVPKGGIFRNESGLSIVGNPRLCGGILELKLPGCNFKKHQKRTLDHTKIMIIAIISGLFGVILMLTLFVSLYCLWYTKRIKKPAPSDDHVKNYPNLSYQTLLKATNGFASENLIGRGTFGVVYKGILNDQDAAIVAIKVFRLEQHGASKSFMAECGVLRNIRHRNLVKVLNVCSSIDFQGTDFKALVYEYMVEGSLQDWLYPDSVDKVGNTNDSPRSLNLRQRIDIIIDVASAMEYLHYHCGTSIVHCDLKPSNVLLDEEMVAHVSDFGLAKLLSKNICSSHAYQTSSSLGVRGTIGYTPPEYGVGNEISTNGDVYSFGILLLEIFTGKNPTNDMFNGGISLHYYVKAALPERMIEILDRDLLPDLDGEDINRKSVLEGLKTILEIGITCSAELPQERLDMCDVSRQLSSIKKKLFGTPLPRTRRIREGPWR